ncbi:putative quinol monooxygenase [Kribbella sp.]|uniref:putative quinol monooxygenase n=1 Tax=Kribbella sp. TaxID=1871183 RepID=UPI002D66FF4D|nr:putative quinol monooxygenase [Kribbella sp.]HZX06398.1 putative quinol monooxygenase [Kribbella sp.]
MSRNFLPDVADDLPAGERPMVAIVRSIPGHEDRLAAAITVLTAAVRAEPGCREFRSFRGIEDPGTFYLYEVYADIDAFRNHLTTGHVAHFFTELAEHSTSDATALVQVVELAAGSGAALQ